MGAGSTKGGNKRPVERNREDNGSLMSPGRCLPYWDEPTHTLLPQAKRYTTSCAARTSAGLAQAASKGGEKEEASLLYDC